MRTLLLIFILFLSGQSFAITEPDIVTGNGTVVNGPNTPPPPCTSQEPAGNTCSQSTTICDLNGYCGNTSASYSADYWTELNNEFAGSIENNSFINFVAGATSISFNLWVYNCQNGDGIQLMVFDATNCSGRVTNNLTWNPAYVPNSSVIVTVNGLVVGRTYNIMVDGYANDVCSYVLTTNAGSNILTPPVVTSSAQTACLGDAITLSATGGNGVYNWIANNGLPAGSTGPTVTFIPSGVGTHTYTTQSSQGNINCLQQGAGVATVVVETCACTMSAAVSQANFCANGTETFTLTASMPETGTIAWTGPNGYSYNGAVASNVIQPTAPGTYVYTATGTVGTETCTATVEITVNPTPTAVLIGTPKITCLQQTQTLSITSTHTQSYAWSQNGQLLGTNPTLTITDGGTYTLGLTSDKNCLSTFDFVIPTDTIRPPVTLNTPTVITCTNTTSTALITTPITGATFTWTGPAIVSSANTANITVNASGTYNYAVTNPVNGCVTSGAIEITSNLTPPEITADNTAFINCMSSAANIILDIQPTQSSIVWAGPNGYNSTSNPIAVAENGSYTATVTNLTNGCTATHQVIVAGDFRVPNANFTLEKNTGCVPYMNTLTAVENNADFTYSWIIDNTMFTSGSSHLLYEVIQPGCLDVELIVLNRINGCTDNVLITNAMCGIERPVAKIHAQPPYLMSYDDPNVNFHNISTNYTSQTWVLPDQSTDTRKNINYDFTGHSDDQTFLLIVGNDAVCYDTAKVIIPYYDDISLFVPNSFTPDKDSRNQTFKISLVGGYDINTFNLYIFNRWGEMIWESHDPEAAWDGNYNGLQVPQGTYSWVIDFKRSLNDEVKSYSGSLNLLR